MKNIIIGLAITLLATPCFAMERTYSSAPIVQVKKALPIINAPNYPTVLIEQPQILPIIPERPIQVVAAVKQDEVTSTDYAISADVLFDFDKSTLRPSARVLIDELINTIMSTYTRVDGITITGHTDRLGSEQYNYRLGMARAETLATELTLRGVNKPINVYSAGEQNPVTNGCPNVTPRSALKACLQPDRRAIINVVGLAKVAVK